MFKNMFKILRIVQNELSNSLLILNDDVGGK